MFILRILTPEATSFSAGQVSSVRIMLTDGPISILAGHAPLIARTAPGRLDYTDQAGDHNLEVGAGILRVRGSDVTILTNGVEGTS